MPLARANAEQSPTLTDAERGVVDGLLRGLAYAEIAELRRASARTVANQVAAVYRKTGTRSRTELAARRYPVSDVLDCNELVARALPSLSERERRVACYAARGLTNKWIAAELGATLSTVASHLRRIMRKLGLRCRVELARALHERALFARESCARNGACVRAAARACGAGRDGDSPAQPRDTAGARP